MTKRWIYFFGQGQADGNGDVKHLIGGKGASLADMTRGGLNVPPGFTISTECCDYFYKHNQQWPDDLDAELRANLHRLESIAGRRFGVGAQPLLVAVRSGAAQSMPGMMDTVLNVGLNPECVAAMAERTGNPRGAWEAYLHFFLMYAHTVGGIADDALMQIVQAFCKDAGAALVPGRTAKGRAEKVASAAGHSLKERSGEPALTPGPSPIGRGEEIAGEEDLDAALLEALCYRLRDFYSENTKHEFPTDPWAMLCASINAVFLSWNTERALAYRQHHKIDGLLGTAVNVQVMCPAEVSGVMFTANPVNQAPDIIIESAYGLGEAIVLGKVTPDRFVLDKNSLALKERIIAHKNKRVATLAEDGQGQTGTKDDVSLADEQIRMLARLGQRVESHFQVPCDIEWALSSGQFYLLQARAIQFKPSANAIDPAEREKVRREEIAALKAMAEPAGTVWSRFNLAEVLPEPLPMTWDIVKRFMSGRGGFGQMYRDLGFDPDPALDDEGIFDLICGRPYCNLSREPRMQYRSMPFEHHFDLLKRNPNKALYPQAIINPRRAGLGFFIKVPLLFFKMWWSQIKQHQLIHSFADQFTKEILPPYLAEVERATHEDWGRLSAKELHQRMQYWIQRTLFDFARHSLKPTALAALVHANLERGFAARMKPINVKPAEAFAIGSQKAQTALRELVIGVHPDEHTDLPSAICALRAKKLSREEFLRRFGHRGSQEMELAQPRWSEDHAVLDRMIDQAAPVTAAKDLDEAWRIAWLKLADEAKLMPQQRPAVEAELRRLQAYMGLRETAKHHLMRGYALIRRALVELDRRYQLQGDIFYLSLDDLTELVRLQEGKAPDSYVERIAVSKHRREVALSLPLPTVIFSDDLDAVGRATSLSGSNTMQGVPLSAGVVEAAAWVLHDPTGVDMPHEPYILVCPSTDPAWVPLFTQARGLVMETGGMLSHGAIVAREFGLPAVAGIADVHRRIKTGQRLRIDGSTGSVSVLG